MRRLGAPPVDRARHERWLKAVSTIAAYRDRWKIGDDHRLLGPDSAVKMVEALDQRKRVESAIKKARQLSRDDGERRSVQAAKPIETAYQPPAGVDI